MAVLIIKQNPYNIPKTTEYLVNYLLNPIKMPSKLFGGQGVSLISPINTIQTIKNVFCHNTGKQMEHFILAFDKKELKNLSPYKIINLGYAICEFFQGRQALFACHEINDEIMDDEYDNSNIHIHFVLNTTNVISGYKDRLELNNVFDLKRHIEALIWNMNIGNTLSMYFK